PLVVLSPGFTQPVSTLTSLAEDLASRGYVVAGIDHPYESHATPLADGRIAECLSTPARPTRGCGIRSGPRSPPASGPSARTCGGTDAVGGRPALLGRRGRAGAAGRAGRAAGRGGGGLARGTGGAGGGERPSRAGVAAGAARRAVRAARHARARGVRRRGDAA